MDKESKTRDCPYCNEEIKVDAIKCKHCGSSVAPERPSHEGTCPYCAEEIKPDAIKCKHCKSFLLPMGRMCRDIGIAEGLPAQEIPFSTQPEMRSFQRPHLWDYGKSRRRCHTYVWCDDRRMMCQTCCIEEPFGAEICYDPYQCGTCMENGHFVGKWPMLT